MSLTTPPPQKKFPFHFYKFRAPPFARPHTPPPTRPRPKKNGVKKFRQVWVKYRLVEIDREFVWLEPHKNKLSVLGRTNVRHRVNVELQNPPPYLNPLQIKPLTHQHTIWDLHSLGIWHSAEMVVPYRRFGITYLSRLGKSQAVQQNDTLTGLPDSWEEDKTRYVVPKRPHGTTSLHCVKFQKKTVQI